MKPSTSVLTPEKCKVCGNDYTEDDMVECEDCKLWYHYACVGVNDSIADETWKCAACEGKGNPAETSKTNLKGVDDFMEPPIPLTPKEAPEPSLKNALALLELEQKELDEMRQKYALLSAAHERVTNEYGAVKRLLESDAPKQVTTVSVEEQFRQAWEKRSKRSEFKLDETDDELSENSRVSPKIPFMNAGKLPHKESELSQLAVLMKQAHVEDLPKFAGDAKHWPLFMAVYKRTTTAASIDDVKNIGRLTNALEGEARELVLDQLTYGINPAEIIKTLEKRYGKKDVILKTLTTELLSFPALSGQRDPKMQKFAVSLKTYVAQLKSLDLHRSLKSDLVESLLLDKLVNIPSMYRKWKAKKESNEELGVEDLAEFVMKEWECLPPATDDPRNTERNAKQFSKPFHVHSAFERNPERCPFCEGAHPAPDCYRFKRQDIGERWRMVKKLRLCFCCLSSKGHRVTDCPAKTTCNESGCDKLHHRSLHSSGYRNFDGIVNELNVNAGEFSPNTTILRTPESSTSRPATTNHQTHAGESTTVNAKVVPVRIFGANGLVVEDFAFLDDGSSLTMMNQSIADKLGIDGAHEQLVLQWTKGITRVEESKRCDITIAGVRGKDKFTLRNVYCVPNLDLAPVSQQGTELAGRYPHLNRLPLPDFENVRPGLLIGLEHATMLGGQRVHEGKLDEPLASKTKLGWIVYGRHDAVSVEATARIRKQGFQQCNLHLARRFTDSDEDLHGLVETFFGVERVGVCAKKLRSSEDKRAEAIMEQTLKFADGRYSIGLLWKSDDIKLPDNMKMALRRLLSEEKKLEKDPESLVWMNENVRKLVQKNYARKATPEDLDTKWDRVWNCPMFTVINRNKIPPKRRSVADVAAVERGVSLNSCLLKGPDNLIALPAALCRARENPVMVTADVAEMFHQIRIMKEDQQVQRFLWRDGHKSVPPTIYVMQAMMFGPTCSPSQAQFVKNQHAKKYCEKYPEAAEALVKFMYMDDYFNSHKTAEEAVRITTNAIEICAEMGFDLVQVQSSHAEVIRAIPQRNLKPEMVNLNVDESAEYATKLLGMYWNPAGDVFEFKRFFGDELTRLSGHGERPTKREVLSTLMKFFDPLGLISKYIVRGKWILQDVWREEIGWDEKLPENLAAEWLRFLRAFDEIEKVKIPRWYGGEKVAEGAELVIFVDASVKAYAAVGYFRFSAEQTPKVVLVMAKTKVAPVKPMSIPRLELEAAKLGARLAATIAELHSFPITRRYFLSDSKCVLLQINSQHFKYDTFVAHRLGEILELSTPEEWWHVPTEQNVADDATKENESAESKSRWFHGADFLRLPIEEWPIERVNKVGARRPTVNNHLRLNPDSEHDEHFINRISGRFKGEWKRLVRVVARVIRFKAIAKRQERNEAPLSAKEIENAEKEIFRVVQQAILVDHWVEMPQELQPDDQNIVLGTIQRERGTQMLALYVRKEEGIIRLRTRDRTSNNSYSAKNLILLPKRHEFVQLFLRYLHEKNHHMGFESTIAEARERVWIIAIRQALLITTARCQFCRNRRARPMMPTMGMLHESRTAFGNKPFYFVGVDCFGPMAVKEKRSEVKRWGVIFTCLTFRAVHLEVVHDLSSDQMLLAVRRFIARRGPIRTMFSDNGLNFKGSANALKEEVRQAQMNLRSKVADEMSLEWRFIPAYSPWMGGAWERLIGYIKKCIDFTLSGETPNDSVLLNALIEAELLTNKRPLTHTPIDPDDEEPLCPNTALFGSSDATQALCPNESRNKCAKLSRKRVAHLVEKFQRRWEREYLPVIAKADLTDKTPRKVKIGDVVLLTEGEENRDNWKLGRIILIHPSSDDVPRIVDVKMGSGEVKYKRSVGNLAVLEVGESTSQ